MSLKAQLKQSIGFSDMIMEKYLADLPPEAFFARPVAGMNHVAWQLGHLISVERRVVEAVKPGSSPALPEGFDAQHAKATQALDDPAAFPTKDQYLAAWKAQREATKAALETMTDEELAQPHPVESIRHLCPTVGAVFNLTAQHALLHAGQFVPVRRKVALPIAF